MDLSDIEIGDSGILVAESLIPSDKCEYLIDYFENMNRAGLTHERPSHKHVMQDEQLFLISPDIVLSLEAGNIISNINEVVMSKMYEPYAKKYDILTKHDKHSISSIKIQKSKIGSGYHVWHGEVMGKACRDRLLTFIIYLNDVDEGGETEFLYYPRRIKPRTGRGILFPCQFQHTHRGNQPLTGEKYIVTGWIEYN